MLKLNQSQIKKLGNNPVAAIGNPELAWLTGYVTLAQLLEKLLKK